MDWDMFFRLAIGVVLLGVGVSFVGKSQGETGSLVGGFLLIGLGLAVVFSKK